MMMTAWMMTVGTQCWGLSLSSISLTDRYCINYVICLVIMWCLFNIIFVAVAHRLILDTKTTMNNIGMVVFSCLHMINILNYDVSCVKSVVYT